MHLPYNYASFAVTLLCLTVASPLSAADDAPPNILFVFADDQAYNTIGSLGNDEIETPNLDRLVRQGTTFTHAYNQGGWHGAICVASRNMLNSGRFLWHAQHFDARSEQERVAGRFWSEYMKSAGYDTYFSGKWHLNANARKAFDYVGNVRPGMPDQSAAGYQRPVEGHADTWKPWDPQFGGYWKGGKHWSEVLGDNAVNFLETAATRDQPFFMYLAFNAPHDPRQSPKEFVDRYPLKRVSVPANFLPAYPYAEAIGCSSEFRDESLAPFPRTEYAVKVNRQEYLAIITHMDAQIGRILDALDESGKANNTYIFFTADHGLAVGHHGLLGKQNMFDHSVRVPFIVCGPDVGGAKRIDGAVYLQDVMPTSLELAGIAKPEHVQFQSILPLLSGDRKENYDAVYGAYMSLQRMVTSDGFKLILYPKIKKVLLFNVGDDPDEMSDLASDAKYQPVVKQLFKKLVELQTETGDTLDLRNAFPDLG